MPQDTVLKVGIKGSAKVEQEIQKINKAYVELDNAIARAGRSINKVTKANAGDEKALQQIDHLVDAYKRLKQNAEDAAKATGALNYSIDTISRGEARYKTSEAYLPDRTSSPGGGAPAENQRRPSRSFFRSRAGGSMLRLLGMGAGMLGIGLGVGALMEGVSAAEKYKIALSDVSKQLQLVTAGHDALGDAITRTSRATGISLFETTQLARTYSTLTGTSAGAMIPALFARGEGMDLGATEQGFGMLGQLGAIAPTDEGMEKFAAMFAQAVQTGHFAGRQEELLRSLVQFAARQTEILGQVVGTNSFLGTLTMMNAHGPAGLRGQYGARYLEQLNAGIRNPHGGGTGLYLMAQALHEKDFFKLKYQMEEGIGGGNLPAIMKYLYKLMPGMSKEQQLQRAYMMHRWLGGSIHDDMTFMKLYHKYGAPKIGGMNKWLKSEGVSEGLAGVSPAQLDILMRLRQLHHGDTAGLTKLLSSPELSDMSKAEKQKIVASGSIKEALKAVLKDKMETPADRLRISLESLKTDLTQSMGHLTTAVTKLATDVNKIYNWLQKHWPFDHKRAAAEKKEIDKAIKNGELPSHLGMLRGGDTAWKYFKGAWHYMAGLPAKVHSAEFQLFEENELRRIAHVESRGSYTKVNPYTGAYGKYQFMPKTWARFAPKAGLPANAPMTPANQERVARAMWLHYWKEFHDPRLVAAAWYGGGYARALEEGKVSAKAFYSPQAHGELSMAEYIKNASGYAWHLSHHEYLHSLAKSSAKGSRDDNPSEVTLHNHINIDGQHKKTQTVKTTSNGNAFQNPLEAHVHWSSAMEEFL